MSVDFRIRERILKAVEDVRKAAAKHNEHGDAKPMASIHPFPAERSASTESPGNLHLMLPEPHTSIW